MSQLWRSLRVRLVLSHIAVVVVGVVLMVAASSQLGPIFLRDDLHDMRRMMGDAPPHVFSDFESGINAGLLRALMMAAVGSTVIAVVAAMVASSRVLRPLQAVRMATRRLAAGSYHERLPIPDELELAELASDVNALAQTLEETEQRRLQLVSEVAHELRTPLATLKGYMEGLLDGVFEPSSETFASAAREAARLERLASDLSSLSRIEEGHVELHLDNIDLVETAAEVAERLRPQFDDKGVALVVESGPALPVTADKDRLAQVFTNVIGNALTYTPIGGSVTVRPRHNIDMASVSILDTGRGLSADQLQHVFERFYRVDRSAPGGTGIGLTVARRLTRLHGGDITATSPGLDRGSTFTVTLPLATDT